MHGRGPKAGAPASDAAGRGDAAGTPQTARPCRVGPRRAMWQVPNRADAAEVGADSAELGTDAAKIEPTRSVSAVSACIGRISLYRPKRPSQAEIQKKKKVQPPDPSHFVQPLSLRPSSPLQKNPGKSRVHNYISLWKIP